MYHHSPCPEIQLLLWVAESESTEEQSSGPGRSSTARAYLVSPVPWGVRDSVWKLRVMQRGDRGEQRGGVGSASKALWGRGNRTLHGGWWSCGEWRDFGACLKERLCAVVAGSLCASLWILLQRPCSWGSGRLQLWALKSIKENKRKELRTERRLGGTMEVKSGHSCWLQIGEDFKTSNRWQVSTSLQAVMTCHQQELHFPLSHFSLSLSQQWFGVQKCFKQTSVIEPKRYEKGPSYPQ